MRPGAEKEFARHHNERLCAMCGVKLGKYVTFTIFNLAATVNRVVSDLPSHLKCAEAAVNRPDLATTCALWTCRGYALFLDEQGRPLLELGNPDSVTWWREGRPATRQEVMETFRSGLPLLEAACELETLVEHRVEARPILNEKVDAAMQ